MDIIATFGLSTDQGHLYLSCAEGRKKRQATSGSELPTLQLRRRVRAGGG